MASKQHRYLYSDYKKAMDYLLIKGMSFGDTSILTGVSINTLQIWKRDAKIRARYLSTDKL